MASEVFAREEGRVLKREDYSKFSDGEIWELRDKGDKGVVDWLFEKHSRLVYYVINKRCYKYKLDERYSKDLEQEGLCGLLHAIKVFDFSRGNAFSTCAEYWIRCYLNLFLSKSVNLINVDPHLYRVIFNVNSVISRVMALENEMPDSERLADITGYSVTMINIARNFSSHVGGGELSLDAPVSGQDNEGRTLMDVLSFCADDSAEKERHLPDLFWDLFETRFKLNNLSRHKERDLEIFKLRFGFNEGKKLYNNDEIGEIYGLSRERVRQIVERVLSFIRSSGVLMDLLRSA